MMTSHRKRKAKDSPDTTQRSKKAPRKEEPEPKAPVIKLDPGDEEEDRPKPPKDVYLLFDIPEGDLIILTGTSTGGTTPLLNAVRVYSQVMSNASAYFKTALDTESAVDKYGGRRLTVSEPHTEPFVELCKLLHSADEYERFRIVSPKDVLEIARLTTQYSCKKAVMFAMSAWFYRSHSHIGTMPRSLAQDIAWYMTLAALEFRSSRWFYTWTGFFLFNSHLRDSVDCPATKQNSEICKVLRGQCIVRH